MPLTKDEVTMLLDRAMAEPIGLLIATNDPERLRQKLYAARARAGSRYELLQFRMSPWPEGQLVVCKRTVGAQARPGGAASLRPSAADEQALLDAIDL
jgi:hypothetical protein